MLNTIPAANPHLDQASRLREIASRRSARRRPALTLAITSGKGGVGKTNVAVNLAVCLAARGLRTTLVDLDMGLANADLLLGLETRYNLAHVLCGTRRLEEIGCTAAGGVHFISGTCGTDRLADLSGSERQALIRDMKELEEAADALVLDCGAGISQSVLSYALAADTVMVVTTPEPTAMSDAYATIKALTRRHSSAAVQVVVNMADSRTEARATSARIAAVAEKFLKVVVADAGYMLQDTHVEHAVRRRVPVVLCYPRCTASVCMATIATRLAAQIFGAPRSSGLLGRVVGALL